jgi:hypothetical protein
MLVERKVQHAAEAAHHLAARLRPAGLEEADVAARDLGLQRERELAQLARLSPVPEQAAERGAAVASLLAHTPSLADRRRAAITCHVMAAGLAA